MKKVSELNNRYKDQDIYIVGTGTSVRTFPTDFLENKVTIGLNMAWKIAPVKYCITTRPELNVPEFMPGEKPHPEVTWISKFEKLTSDEQREYAKDRFYFFESKYPGQKSQIVNNTDTRGRNLDWVKSSTEDYLYLWTSISQTAANLAANMGAKNIIFIGCDNGAINGNHHAHDQHTMWRMSSAETRYNEYYEGLAEIRSALRERGVNMLSLTPFLSLMDPASDFKRLCDELGKPEFIENKNIADRYGIKNFLKSKIRQSRNVFLRN